MTTVTASSQARSWRAHRASTPPMNRVSDIAINPPVKLCEAVFNGVMTLDQVEAMLVETAVNKACGNLSKAARMLGLTRRQLAYRLDRLHAGVSARRDDAVASSRAGHPP